MSELKDLKKEKEKLQDVIVKLLFDFREKFPEVNRVDLRAESYGNHYYDSNRCSSMTTSVDINIKI